MRSSVFLALLFLIAATGAGGNADSDNQAALVVVHGDGRVVTRCVGFAEPQLSGLELLQRSGLDLSVDASAGAAICRLDAEGCAFPQQSCFCQCTGGACEYWSYWRWEAGAWRYSQLGAANSVVLPGVIEGWVWGAGTVDAAASPPQVAFAAICAPATSTPTGTATGTATGTPTATATSTAPASVTPTSTPTSSPYPTIASTSTPVPPTATPTDTPTPVLAAQAIPAIPTAGAAPAMPAPVIETFAAARKEIAAGESVTIFWRTRNADSVQVQAFGKGVNVANEGSLLLAPPQNTTYQLVAANAGGTVAAGMTIIVRPRARTPALAQPSGVQQPAVAEPTVPAAPAPPSPLLPTTPPTDVQPAVSAAPMRAAAVVAPSTLAPPTLAPVALVAAVPTRATALAPASAADHSGYGETLSPMVLGLLGLLAVAGVPAAGLAIVVVLWLLRRLN